MRREGVNVTIANFVCMCVLVLVEYFGGFKMLAAF